MALSNSMTAKLQDLTDRFEEVSALLANGEVVADRQQFANLSREFAELEPITRKFQRFLRLEKDSNESTALAKEEDDEDLRTLGRGGGGQPVPRDAGRGVRIAHSAAAQGRQGRRQMSS